VSCVHRLPPWLADRAAILTGAVWARRGCEPNPLQDPCRPPLRVCLGTLADGARVDGFTRGTTAPDWARLADRRPLPAAWSAGAGPPGGGPTTAEIGAGPSAPAGVSVGSAAAVLDLEIGPCATADVVSVFGWLEILDRVGRQSRRLLLVFLVHRNLL